MGANYIHHLRVFFDQVHVDDRVAPSHISLYMALFQEWNALRFPDTFQVSRALLMARSKIKSKTTYSKTLVELDQWGYVTYQPSHNPYVKSQFTLTKKWTTSGPPIAQPSPESGLPLVPDSKPLNNKQKNMVTPPTKNEVVGFFASQRDGKKQAMKFWHHYEALGWAVGGSPIRSWQAIAKKWILGTYKNSRPVVQKVDHLHLSASSDYDAKL